MIERTIIINGLDIGSDPRYGIDAATRRPDPGAYEAWTANRTSQHGVATATTAWLRDVVWPVRIHVYGGDHAAVQRNLDQLLTYLLGTKRLVPVMYAEAEELRTTQGRVREVLVLNEAAGAFATVEARIHIPEPIWIAGGVEITTVSVNGASVLTPLYGGNAPTRVVWEITGPANSFTVRQYVTREVVCSYEAAIAAGTTVTIDQYRAYGREMSETTPNDSTPPSKVLSANIGAAAYLHPYGGGTYGVSVATPGASSATRVRARFARSVL